MDNLFQLINLSNGTSCATSFGFFAFLNVTGPPNEI